MPESHEPLISRTTGNKLVIAAIAGIVTALMSWMVVATLETRQNELLVRNELQDIRSWLEENEDDQADMTARIDTMMEMIVRGVVIQEIRRTNENLERQDETGN